MVSAAAAADGIARARRFPTLRVGLHLVLVDGRPTLPPKRVPDLVDASGHLRKDLARLGLDICARPSVRAQLRTEIEAQFRAYQETGLALDHVNAHRHFHLHPVVANEIISIGQHYGMRGLRVPREPVAVLERIEFEHQARAAIRCGLDKVTFPSRPTRRIAVARFRFRSRLVWLDVGDEARWAPSSSPSRFD